MGSVWLASDLSLDSTCAIKLVDPDKVGNEEVRVRFQREARAAAQIRSANVVDVFDHGLWQGVPFIVMEYLQGEDLGARLDRVGRLDLRQTYDIVAQVARALVRAHAMGIVHRDLKPENIFLVPGDDHEVAKVLDFGIAKLDQYSLRDKTTKTGSFMGTPYYMSPEQARGKNIDWRSDLWALGIIVFQCLTGKPPFESEALGDLMGMILYDPIPRITDRDSSLPPEVEQFWERAINRDRELRFQSAKELADALAETAMLERREVPTLPPRTSLASMADSDQSSVPPTAHALGRSPFDSASAPSLSDASENDFETGAPVSRTRGSVLPTLGELSPLQRKLAILTGIAAIGLIGFGVAMVIGGGTELGPHAAGDSADAPVSEPAAPPTPAVAPRLAEAPPSPLPAISSSADRLDRELDEEQKKKDKKKRLGPAAPAAPAGNPDYGI
ncbi:MAG: serine/threonine protein kinase [Myxococcales bacterium]|nr:MAG: serine/threonine protein kinase [Myxococcales bacterium]